MKKFLMKQQKKQPQKMYIIKIFYIIKKTEPEKSTDEIDNSYDMSNPPGLISTCIFPEDISNSLKKF